MAGHMVGDSLGEIAGAKAELGRTSLPRPLPTELGEGTAICDWLAGLIRTSQVTGLGQRMGIFFPKGMGHGKRWSVRQVIENFGLDCLIRMEKHRPLGKELNRKHQPFLVETDSGFSR